MYHIAIGLGDIRRGIAGKTISRGWKDYITLSMCEISEVWTISVGGIRRSG